MSGSHEFDVIVVGCGGADLAAALAAQEKGARVCILERGRGSWADAIATTVLDANLDDEARVSACLEHLPQQIISSIEAT